MRAGRRGVMWVTDGGGDEEEGDGLGMGGVRGLRHAKQGVRVGMGQEQESWRRGCGGPRARGMLAGEGALSGGRSRRKGPGGLGRGRRARRRRRRKGKRRRKEEKGKERGRGKKRKLDVVEVVDGMRRPGGCEHLKEFWPEAVRELGSVAAPPSEDQQRS